MEQFKYGELVEVRNSDSGRWVPRIYIASAKITERGDMLHCVYPEWESPYSPSSPDSLFPDNPSGLAAVFNQIKKIQKPEPALIDIEQPETEPLFISTQGVFTAEEAVMQLQERIEKILEELKELKTQLK